MISMMTILSQIFVFAPPSLIDEGRMSVPIIHSQAIFINRKMILAISFPIIKIDETSIAIAIRRRGMAPDSNILSGGFE